MTTTHYYTTNPAGTPIEVQVHGTSHVNVITGTDGQNFALGQNDPWIWAHVAAAILGVSTDPMYPITVDPADWYGQDDWEADWEAQSIPEAPETPGGISWVEDPTWVRYGDVQRHGRVPA